MSKKLKLMLLAVLGFSTACSTVRNGSTTDKPDGDRTAEPAAAEEPVLTVDSIRTIRLLYGVRRPQSEVKPEQRDSTGTDKGGERR